MSTAGIDGRLAALDAELVAIRRDLHAHPETAWHETRTTAVLTARLRRAGLVPQPLPGGTGLVCDVGAGGPVVALRGDVDALPLADEKDVPWRSTVPGVAHACGHDVHTTCVLGAGLALAGLAADGGLPGTVRLILQPAEEIVPGGALRVLEAGGLDGVGSIFALHCDPRITVGQVGLRTGPITAATDEVVVRVSGPGGHTARPQLTADVVGALADVATRTPLLLSRRVDPRAALSLQWGTLTAGTASNVIPEHGRLAGTVRVLDGDTWDAAPALVTELVRQVAAPWGVGVEVEYTRGVPPVVNDAGSTEVLRGAVADVLGPGGAVDTPQSMGGEDFAWFLREVPGALARLGVRPVGTDEVPDLHRGTFDVDEGALGVGSRVLAAAALRALRA